MNTALLDQAAAAGFEKYRPRLVIDAVNALQPLGKDEALAQIEASLTRERAGEDFGLFWVLRVLFDVPAERGFPPVRIGQPSIPPPAEPGALPRFPIVLVKDIPFLVVRGYDLGGLAEPVQAHVDYFRENGTIRGRPLEPPASTEGVEVDFLELWKAAYGDAYVTEAARLVQAQIASLD